MKKLYTLLAGALLTFTTEKVMAQTSFTTVDTVKVGVNSNASAPINNTTSSPITIQWKVVSHNMPADWQVGICDNKICYNWPDLWPTNQQTSDPYAPGMSGDIHALVTLTNPATATNGCYYVKVKMSVQGSIGGTDTALVTYILCKAPASVPSVKAVDEVNLYPNPANNELNVVFDAAADIKNVGVYNIIGKLMTVYKVSGNSANLNIENIPAGIYFVRLLNGQGQIVTTRKFTKQ